jgi:hypothetical protein
MAHLPTIILNCREIRRKVPSNYHVVIIIYSNYKRTNVRRLRFRFFFRSTKHETNGKVI